MSVSCCALEAQFAACCDLPPASYELGPQPPCSLVHSYQRTFVRFLISAFCLLLSAFRRGSELPPYTDTGTLRGNIAHVEEKT